MKKVFCLIVVMFCFIIRVNAEDLNLASNAKSAILLEASTGEIIFEKNSFSSWTYFELYFPTLCVFKEQEKVTGTKYDNRKF